MIARLDVYLQDRIEKEYGVRLSRTYIERFLEQGGVLLLNEVIKKKGFTVDTDKHHIELDQKKLQTLLSVYQTGRRQDSEADAWDASEEGIELDEARVEQAADIKPAILFEDDDIVVVFKPPGVSSHPGKGDGGADSMVYQFIKYMKSVHQYVPRAGLLHRLDKETRGILLFAKNMQTYNEVKAQFEKRHIQKYYVAFCDKTPQLNNSVKRILAHLRQHPLSLENKNTEEIINDVLDTQLILEMNGNIGKIRSSQKMVYTPDTREARSLIGSKSCVSDVFPFYEGDKEIGLLFLPHTGRTHQIRAQAKFLGAPVKNDRLYGNLSTSGGMLGLCAVGISLTVRGIARSFWVSREQFFAK